jgi:chromosome partitioning protein
MRYDPGGPLRTARTIAIWHEKGGTGKSTTAVNLASALAARGRRVLVVDLDPQGTATDWIGCTCTFASSGSFLWSPDLSSRLS